MTTDDDVFHAQDLNGELHNAEAIEVRGNDLVGDVAVNENYPRRCVDDEFGGDPAVRAPNPEKLRVLLFELLLEKGGVFLQHFVGPSAIFKE